MNQPTRKSPALGGAHDQPASNDHAIITPVSDIKASKIRPTPTAVIVVNITPKGFVCMLPGKIGKAQFGEIGQLITPFLYLHYCRRAAAFGGLVHLAGASDGIDASPSISIDDAIAWEQGFQGGGK